MQVLQIVYQCRELSSAILRLTVPDTLRRLNDALELSTGGSSRLHLASDDDVSNQTAQVIRLVLQDIDRPDYSFPMAPTAAGAEALQALQRAVFGGSSLSGTQHSLMQAVFCGSVAQAQRTLQLCAATLLDCMAPKNCLVIYNVATSCKCESLRQAAHSFGLRNFSAAAQLDYAGLTLLSLASLMGFLCSDDLQVASELDVFSALMTWVRFDPANRMRDFARRLTEAVRLPLLSVSDLIYLDSHPLVEKDKMALQVVAHAYLSKATGAVCDMPFGLATVGRPRNCYTQRVPSDCQTESDVDTRDSSLGSPLCAESSILVEGSLGRQAISPAKPRRSALAKLVQTLAMEGADAATAPGTPLPPACSAPNAPAGATIVEQLQPSSLVALLLGAPTPAMRAASQSPPPLTQQGGKARDVVPNNYLATRRTLFCASSAQCCGGTERAIVDSARCCPTQRSLHVGGEEEAIVARRMEVSVPHTIAALAPSGSEKLSGCLDLEMMLSPTKAGIRDWLTSAEAAPVPEFWPSKKRLRYN